MIPRIYQMVLLLACSMAVYPLTLELQQRDPQTSAPILHSEQVDPKKIGIIVVDMWNWHWCKTSTERVSALVPRMNQSLDRARSLGMTIFLCPTDVADNYAGTPMLERVMAIEPVPIPQGPEIECPPAPDGGGCTCGPERCQVSYGWDGMHPQLSIGPDDFMPNDPERLYAICKQRGLTHLIFFGVHTQVCLLGKSIGLRAMSRAGFRCALARDLTDAHGRYEPTVETPDDFTTKVITHFEKYLCPTIDFASMLRRNRQWNHDQPVDLVRHSPWGTEARPHLFENVLTVTLTNPTHPDAAIHFTIDGSEPNSRSPIYRQPLKLSRSATVRARAYMQGKPVSLPSESQLAKLSPVPPAPSVSLGDLKPARAVGMGHSPSLNSHRFSPGVQPPQVDRSNEGKPIVARTKSYERGIGVHGPSQLIYNLDPNWTHFVALAAVDEQVLATSHGSNRAMHSSVTFRVFIDGKLAAESPVMRISFEPWRFHVPIPPGSKQISLTVTDAGDGHYMDLANWINAGFLRLAN